MSALKQAQRFVLQPPGAQLHLIAVDRPVWGVLLMAWAKVILLLFSTSAGTLSAETNPFFAEIAVKSRIGNL